MEEERRSHGTSLFRKTEPGGTVKQHEDSGVLPEIGCQGDNFLVNGRSSDTKIEDKVMVPNLLDAAIPQLPLDGLTGKLLSSENSIVVPPSDVGGNLTKADCIIIPHEINNEVDTISQLSSHETPVAAGEVNISDTLSVPVEGESDADDSDLIENDEEDIHLQQEVLRIEKESGHAKRVFEKRILKHKSIQVG